MSTSASDSPSPLALLARSVAAVGALSVGAAVQRAVSTAGGYLAVAILFGVSLCFFTLAGYRAISVAMGSILASLIVGCAYFFLALITALVLQARRR